MSSVINPVGRQPAWVYWVRRGIALAVVVVLLLGARWVWHHTFGRGSATGTGPQPGSSSGPTPAPSPTKTSSPSQAPSPATQSPTSTGTSDAVRQCSDSDLTVTASTDAASYVVGSTPRLRMRIQNRTSTPCQRDIGAAQNELIITSGGVHVWSSDDCHPGGVPDLVVIQPDQSYSVSVTWLGRLSQPGCPAGQPFAQPGSYSLVGRNGTLTSDPAIFAMTQG